MRSAQRKKVPRYPTDWSAFPGGDAIRLAVESVSDELSQRIFGYHMVKLGSLSSQISLSRCAVSHHISQTPTLSPFCSVVAQAKELPYVENSIDGFLLANELDFAQDPHQILREVDRCITQSGYVIISGFNPYSLTGLGKYLPIKRGNMLHDARCFSAPRVKDWLGLLGFEIIEQRNVLFSMLFFNQRRPLPSQWHNRLSRYLPWCSSVYVILARKRVWPMTTIRPKWKLKPQFSPVGASMRFPHDDSAANRHT
ncbi:methyltransferase domain-containing protein [Salinimonas sediminis]|uniref:Methyltransferase domain-containing protein n=1 Tax=Salinimonas sediminis TaxID=2303538 RepID=A0A346NND3_9ALTE|nr:methyltransferase domain-containing protein [Salinimonas sediminis]AXR07040.1 methyltransferase domain-containing protein [Salinimonas sediminis]